ncbi:MAG: hypothetical protein KGL39_30125 [Patescibacteria group bacterium]|nr:hypothetical protein [Patescibacteria group bacterium]
MSEKKETEKPADTSLYRRWRNRELEFGKDFEHADDGDLVKNIRAGKVQYFELTQDVNIATSYIRCFYQLVGSAMAYQEVPLDRSKLSFDDDGKLETDSKAKEDDAIWKLIDAGFDVAFERFRMRCTLKKKSSLSSGR